MMYNLFESLEVRRLLAADVTIDATQRFQQMQGFGTSLASYVSGLYNSAWTDMYYQDLGSSMLRMDLNINALRGPDNDIATPVTMVDDIDQNIAQFDFHQSRVQPYGDVAMASLTKKIDDFKLIGSIWSPPHWMKGPELSATTGQPNGNQPAVAYSGFDSSGGSLIDTPENLQQFGRYVAAYVKGFQQTYGVGMYALSIQNELAFHEPYSSCVYTAPLYVKAVKAVADAFADYGIKTRIQGPEDVGVASTTNTGILARQFMYINAVRADAAAMKDVSIYSIHGYATESATPGRSPEMWREYWNGRPSSSYPAPNWTGIANDGKPSWMTETSGEAHTMDGAMELAGKTMDAIVQGNVGAYDYWQTSMSSSVYDNQALTAGTDLTDKKYNVAKQFFRYIRPGSYRVAATPSNPTDIYISAFTDEKRRTLTVLLQNFSTKHQGVNLSVAGGSGLGNYSIARVTSPNDNFSDIGPVNIDASGVASLLMPGRSIVTLQAPFTPPDLTPPDVVSSAFDFETEEALRMSFSESVANSVSAADLTLQNLTDPSASVSVASAIYGSPDTATFRFSPPVLPDGNYRATLLANSVQDVAGNKLASDVSANFFVFGGDVNRDRTVNLTDFTYVAAYFNQTGKTWSQGDFNYDGKVDLTDFTTLVVNFNKTLAPAAIPRSRRLALTAPPSYHSFFNFSKPTLADDVLNEDSL